MVTISAKIFGFSLGTRHFTVPGVITGTSHFKFNIGPVGVEVTVEPATSVTRAAVPAHSVEVQPTPDPAVHNPAHPDGEWDGN